MAYKDPQREKEQKRKYYLENRDFFLDASKKYYWENRDRVLERIKNGVKQPRFSEEEKKERRKKTTDNYFLKNKKKIQGYTRQFYSKNKDKYRENELIRKFGMTLDEYRKLFKEQNGSCAICGVHRSKLKIDLAVDHNHETKEIRGLLCTLCNTHLGWFDKHGEQILIYEDVLGE